MTNEEIIVAAAHHQIETLANSLNERADKVSRLTRSRDSLLTALKDIKHRYEHLLVHGPFFPDIATEQALDAANEAIKEAEQS